MQKEIEGRKKPITCSCSMRPQNITRQINELDIFRKTQSGRARNWYRMGARRQTEKRQRNG
jgi:hypothetical protein